jgi:RHS repeat-associated protein
MKNKTLYQSTLLAISVLFLSFYFSAKIKNGFFSSAEKASVTTTKQKKTAASAPDKDIIKNTIKTPESPVTGANVPNSIKDIKASNPAQGVQAIALPMGNNMGTANLQFPIKLPTGRNGMQPQVAIQYNSEGGNGWLGLGWDVSFPSIGIETRWGVPRYDAALETETYTMGGEQLTPVSHREEWVNRTSEKRFFPRREGAFDVIVRHGNSPKNYWWEIIAKNGTRSFYGGLPNENVINDAILKDEEGNIAQWALVEVRDNNDNFMRYRYTVVEDNGLQGSTIKGTQLYLDKITYTGHKNTEGVYSVQFIRNTQLGEAKRTDITINARLGFKQVTADLLRKIEVNFKNEKVRSYDLIYKQGAFYKTLLASIAEFDKTGKLFYKHDLEYFDEVRQNGNYQPFKAEKEWSVPNNDVTFNPFVRFSKETSILGGGKSGGFSAGVAVTLGIPGSTTTKSLTIGGSFSFSQSVSEGVISLIDINGDRLPDKVFKSGGRLYFCHNLGFSNAFGMADTIKGVSNFSKSKTRTFSYGVEAHPSPLFVGSITSFSKTITDTYFTDFNADGLMDLAVNGRVYFNHLDSAGNPTFTLNSADTPNPIKSNAPIDTNLVTINPKEQENLIKQFPLHDVVRMWQAPFDGDITINAPVQLLEDTGAIAKEYEPKDGVIVSIQKNGNDIMWRERILKGNFDTIRPNIPNILKDIKKGDKLYFRVQSVFDGAYDQVLWDPEITYVNNPISKTEVDANNKLIHRYKASEDFVLSSPQSLIMPYKGELKIEGLFKKPIPTSDNIILEIGKIKNNRRDTIKTQFFKWNDTVNQNIDLPIAVDSADEITFRLVANNINWTEVSWLPRVYYTKVDNPNIEIRGDSSEPLLDFYPSVEFFMLNNQWRKGEPVVSVVNSTYKVSTYMAFGTTQTPKQELNANVTACLKGINRIYDKKSFTITEGVMPLIFPTLEALVDKKDSLFIELYIDNLKVVKALSTINASLNNGLIKASVFTANEKDIFGPQYRGWGQFVYNGNEERANKKIDERDLKFDRTNVPKVEKIEKPDDANFTDENDPTKSNFVFMVSYAKEGLWQGYDNLTYITKNIMSSSRKGEDDIRVLRSVSEGNTAHAPNKISKSESGSISGNLNLFPDFVVSGSVGVSTAWNSTENTLDVLDLFGGEGYPDIVSKDFVQPSNPLGGLEKDKISIDSMGVHKAESSALGVTGGGSGVVSKTSNAFLTFNSAAAEKAASKSNSAKNTAQSSIGINGSYSKNTDKTKHTWLDINGDGLLDKIIENDTVYLNLGYKFSKPERWLHKGIKTGESTDAGGGMGINYGNGSITAGFSVSTTDNHSTKVMQDMNGDGLVDFVEIGKPLKVYLNLGSEFSTTPILWAGAERVDKGSSTGGSINGAFTIGINLLFFRICINPSFSKNWGLSREQVQISDIDGDGFPDVLRSSKDGELFVKSSTIGKTNLLKSVKRPFNAAFTMDYDIVGNTYNMPHSKWVLTQTSFFDGLKGDGADTMKYHFEYENGKYDRRERDFYGFETVRIHQLNTEKQDAVYRTTVQVFNNKNYYEKGLLLKEWVQDEAGKKYTETSNTYELKDISTGTTLQPSFFDNDNGKNAFAALVASENLFFEGQNTAGLKTKTTYGYDKIGNITDVEDFGDGTTNDNIKAKIEYHNNAVTKSEPSQIEVFTKEGLMRKRQTSINVEGNITQIRQYLDGNTSANFDMEYDVYGTMTKITRPENHDKKRFFYEYTYDDVVHSYVVAVKDAYGYSSKSEYEFAFGQLLESTDMSGQKIQYRIDDLGRIKTITGPFELAAGKPYTIAFEYNTEATIPYAVTKHYDPEHNSDIKTITFVDGLMRPVQVKKTGSVFNGSTNDEKMIVSGRVKFDAFGRTIETYYPNTEGVGNETQLNPNYNATPPTKVSYDVLDRTITTTLPDNAKTTMRYEIGKDKTGYTAFKTTMIDALSNKKETYTDVRNRNRTNVDFGDEEICTQFTYNALSELMTVTDNSNHKTEYKYDKLGRKTSIKHPDAGETTFEYDIVGNMTKKITADIRKKIPNGGAIKYTYDYERLVQIDYPRNFQNRVRYTYGKSGDKFNRAGRIVLQQDGSGGQEFYYGKLGEITKNIRTIYVNPTTVVTYISEAEYDTWNRLKTMTYPDGEKLTYKYNRAGKLLSMSGKKTDTTYNYVAQVGYDEFEQRTFLKYGNGSVTRYKYENDRRRLSNMTVDSKGANIINNRYRYDVMNNVLSVENAISGNNLKMGGPAKHNYRYDKLYRLTQAEGSWRRETRQDNYTLNMSYDNLHNITEKVQTHTQNGRNVKETTYSQEYFYNSQNQPHAPNKIGKELYAYDGNGNLTEIRSENAFALNRQLLTWDEENRLMNISKNGIISQFTYDAQGERVIKSSGNFTGVYINGALAGALGHQKNYTLYVSPYLVVREGEFSKHYYIEGQRIVSKIGVGEFNNRDWNKTLIKAGNIDYAATFKDMYEKAKGFFRGFGYPPGQPTKPYVYAHPDSTGIPTPSVSTPSITSSDTLVRFPVRAPVNEPPGAPIQFKTVHKDSLGAGYGFEDKLKKPENQQFFYHPDHLGSTSYITDITGAVYQHMEYMPFGETFVEETSKDGKQPYLFNGKELDSETGLYYYGARYYNPKIAMWLGVDPMAETTPNWSPYRFSYHNPIKWIDPDGNKEYENEFVGPINKSDWHLSDRENNTSTWKNANKYNLGNNSGNEEYTSISQRSDFYNWFQNETKSLGYETQWAGAASKVADAIDNLAKIANGVGLDEISDFANKGNKEIFDNVFPKLATLQRNGPIKGQEAQSWDAKTLAQEQTLVQPLYNSLSSSSKGMLNYTSKQIFPINLISKGMGMNVSPFPKSGNLLDVKDRWSYGMSNMGYKNIGTMPKP